MWSGAVRAFDEEGGRRGKGGEKVSCSGEGTDDEVDVRLVGGEVGDCEGVEAEFVKWG